MSEVLTFRYYQEEAITSIFEYFRTHPVGNPIVGLPTGTGKSLVIAGFLQRALGWWPQTRVLVVTHVKELIQQNFDELLNHWPSAPAGIYSAGLKRRDTHLPITFCGIASIAKRAEDFGHIDLVLIDECHMVSDKSASSYSKAIGILMVTNPLLRVIGLTATPFRLGMGHMMDGKLFTDMCVDYCSMDGFNKLVEEGYIAPLIPKRTLFEIDTSQVGIQGGEFIQEQLQAAVDKETITRGALEEAVRLGKGRKHWLVFCTGTKHADHARDILTELGVPTVSVHTDLPGGTAMRDHNIKLFKGGWVGAMAGVGVFTTGFNFKPIDCIVVLRPTMSAGLWVQMLGRGTRPAEGKTNCLVLDFAANTKRLGPINDPVMPRKKGKKGKGAAPYKICPACDTYNHARARFCICCGQEFPEYFNAETKAATDELIRKMPIVKEAPKPIVIERFTVERVEYDKHWSRDATKPPSLRITYYCGSRTFNEWLCLEHKGFALHKARDTWRLMESTAHPGDNQEPPDSVDEALQRVNELAPPSHVRVHLKEKFSEIVGYDFDAMEFVDNTVHVSDDDVPF